MKYFKTVLKKHQFTIQVTSNRATSNLIWMIQFSPDYSNNSLYIRKAGSGNIFSNVNLWQLQRLFRAAGDHDAEQRAKLVWGLGDEADLAQALIGLRARSHRKRLRTNERSALGSHWLQAFSHLR
uniref:Arginine vasopressin-induced protein 1 n=1 Tax=Oryzias latipes TaxID=8090 RepID=A0A3P9J3S3_ORYLA